jgi:carbon-monoxide dehydrogenase medium subunit
MTEQRVLGPAEQGRQEPTAFEYQRADSWDEAVELLRIWRGEAKIIAGGQSLVPMMNLRLTLPQALIDVNGIGDRGGPRLEDGPDGATVVVPALTRHTALLASDVIAEHCPLLHRAVRLVGNVRVRNRGTFGGSVAHADPTAEIPCCVLALGGSIRLQGPQGIREVPATGFFRTYLTTAAEPGEVVTEVRMPSAAGETAVFTEEVRRYSDFATVSVAVQSRSGRPPAVVLGGVADRPLLVGAELIGAESTGEGLVGEELTVAQAVADSVHPESDAHASAEHRRRLVRVLVRRALAEAAGPATGNGALS